MNEYNLNFNGNFYSTHITEDEWRAFIDEEPHYYINKWKNTDSPAVDGSWNWGAFFGGVIWLGYRKMYKQVFIYFLILFPIFFIDYFFKINILGKFAVNIASIILGVYGNAIYFNFARRKIQTIKSIGGHENTESLLRKSGGISVLGICLVIVVISVFLFAIIQIDLIQQNHK